MTRPLVRFCSLAAIIVLAVLLLLPGIPAAEQQKTEGRSVWHQGRPMTPAGELVMDLNTRQPAVGALPMNLVRSPDSTGPDGKGRYLLAVNSGFGIQFSAATNRAQQSLALIDLSLTPPAVVQNVYFPTPQSAQIGAVFSPQPDSSGAYTLYVSGGVENKIWLFRFRPGAREPITPPSPGPATQVQAPAISVAAFATAAPSPRYHGNREPVYPMGLALSPDGDTLFVANNLSDNLGIIRNLRGTRRLERVDLRGGSPGENAYPYLVLALPQPGGSGAKVYVSCWGTGKIAVVDAQRTDLPPKFIPVGRHPTHMIANAAGTRIYVVNSNDDSVSVIDSAQDREIERISVRLAETQKLGASPEGLALSADEKTLYVANAHANAVAVVALSREAAPHPAPASGNTTAASQEAEEEDEEEEEDRSRVRGFIPAGNYPSAVAVANGLLFIANGKGTGFESSSVQANTTGLAPNTPNDRFPAGSGRGMGRGGQYILSFISGNISWLREPGELELAGMTQQAMRNVGLLGEPKSALFPGGSPFRHIIYVIRENRTYDQVFGDLERAGNGQKADGDPRLAIFGAGEAARLPGGPPQNIMPNARALALRFGLFDRFFVNSEASPDGHKWSTAAFSTDYTDKAYRWNYSGRGRTYDFEGFNRLPATDPVPNEPSLLPTPATADDIANFMKRYIPYLSGSRDIAEPETLYLWDAAARARLTYRNYGEFVATISQADLDAFNANRRKSYPDLSPTVKAFPTKQSLEGHFSPTYRNYDLETPDALTVECYKAVKAGGVQPPYVAMNHPDARCRGYSRIADFLEEFRGYVREREAGRGDPLPNFVMLRLPNDHTAGLAQGMPTPQFLVAENDYALGLLVEAVSNSPYWKDTAIFVLEDDAQDGPDHVDAHRSPALVISAYNRPGALIHEFHNTVSLIRTMELLLGLQPMNLLDANAVPMDIFQESPDLRPYRAQLPEVAPGNLLNPPPRDPQTAYWIRRTEEQNLAHADIADPRVLNEIIWFSVRGSAPMPEIARLPAYDALRAGILEEAEEHARGLNAIQCMRTLLARRQWPENSQKE
jgi:YVTN family beta-propeller protein